MNTLSYGLLGLLARASRSGYELMQYIQPFWQAKHSQIYPLLAKMEQEGYVTHEVVLQSDKPDKKVYSITSKGSDKLKIWINEPTTEPVLRDEMMLKAYSLWLTDPESAVRLFSSRAQMYADKLAYYENLMQGLKERESETSYLSPASPAFGRYILLQKALDNSKNGQNWCEWVLSMLKNG
ncbi:hypothetical protein SY83_04085 [Paenibacillus swuensis]|uniref:PadR family transcriptional regulator n=1 Tax=Paenibacillus swuensis TaxID=1178515 RepID=A0A172TFA4_9BACL|nr:PadR family transcriptional regulator [Paenibacillus swuensis]ANE45616.1 hypothetical protein SY83_04085 [Paenibacillus swuensis]